MKQVQAIKDFRERVDIRKKCTVLKNPNWFLLALFLQATRVISAHTKTYSNWIMWVMQKEI